MNNLFTEEPHIEWYHDTPFAIARLNIKYAHSLSKLSLKYESDILKLKADEKWLKNTDSTSARYQNYNAFLLDSAYMNLFLAVRKVFRFLLSEIDHKAYPCYIRSWYNVTRFDQDIFRHSHQARFIGSFLAFTEGSTTSYGPLKDSDKEDHIFENKDGMLILTKSNGANFHQVSKWNNPEHPRISYAFDITEQCFFQKNSSYIPFDG